MKNLSPEPLLFFPGTSPRVSERIRTVITTWIEDERIKELALYLYQNPSKEFRARYALELGQLLGGTREGCEPVAIVAELIHTASLIHDDLVDEASERRGLPVLHRVSSTKSAVLTGDLLLGVAYAYATTVLTPTSLRLLGPAMFSLALGETKEAISSGVELSLKERENIVAGKTGALFAWIGGALCYELNRNELSGELWSYGLLVGRAYQLTDDLGDLLGVLPGKNPYQDERHKVPTLARYLLSAESKGNALLREITAMKRVLLHPPLPEVPPVILSLVETLEHYALRILEDSSFLALPK